MSLIEVEVFVVCRFGLGFLVYIFTLLVFKFMAHRVRPMSCAGVSGLSPSDPRPCIASGGIGGSFVNNAPEAVRRKWISQALMFVALDC